MCLMLLTCPLQEGEFITNQAPPQPITEKSYTVGQSYDTTSGRIVALTTRDDSSHVTMTSTEMGRQVRVIPLSTDDDVITERPLIMIREVKTPTSPTEPSPGLCGVSSEAREGGVLDLQGRETSVMSTLPPPHSPKSYLDELSLSPGPTRESPSMARVVR